MNKLATELRRKQGDRSLRAFARDLGVATGTAEGWVKAWRLPKYAHLPRIAEEIEYPVEEIVTWLINEPPTNRSDFIYLRSDSACTQTDTCPLYAGEGGSCMRGVDCLRYTAPMAAAA